MYTLAFAAMIDADRIDKKELAIRNAYPGYPGYEDLDVSPLQVIPYGIN